MSMHSEESNAPIGIIVFKPFLENFLERLVYEDKVSHLQTYEAQNAVQRLTDAP